MKDIDFVNNILKQHGIGKAEYARNIGTTRQNVQNWSYGGEIPKKFLLPTAQYLSKLLKREVTTDEILSISEINNTKKVHESATTKG